MPTYGACDALVVRDAVGIVDSAVDPTSFRKEPVSRSSGNPSTFTYVALGGGGGGREKRRASCCEICCHTVQRGSLKSKGKSEHEWRQQEQQRRR